MEISTIVLLVLLVAVGLLLAYGVAIYNRLVTLQNRYGNAFAQIEVQLKRRYDLIPNLVETAKAYMSHERGTLQAVTEARNGALAGLQAAAARPGEPGAMAELAGAEGALGAALGRLNVVMEAYPDLKASENMRQLSETLTSTENRVAFARQAFNDAVMQYNTYKQSFPPVLLAGPLGHREDAALLEFEDSAEIQAVPRVSF
ncbi:LemA family protein [Halomonas sp. EGI 63088]|uniref:LemA family protein n=1 Tax=Halomonas flagellata TaxID=2920385 RepID=A0ABS9RTZ5_9GAMM|nr:LemA family protein [Halomonas flagellata]MCH4563296.1 LemA family protein [Halomonas flagellata]